MSALRRWWPLFFLALLPLIPLWKAVFANESIGLFDQVRPMMSFDGGAYTGDRAWDVLQADSVLQFYPWRSMVFEAWGNGELPLWNPYELAGTPLLANSQSGGFYPLHILMGLLHIPVGVAMTLLAWFHLAWAGIGVYLLCRRLGATEVGAAIGGASFALSTFMLAWTALPSVITTVAWIPWCLWAVAALFANGRIWRDAALLGLFVGMMILGGHLQFVAYGGLAIVVFAVAQFLGGTTRWRGLAGVAVGLLLGFFIAAPQLLPVLQYSQFSHRRTAATAEGYEAYVGSSLKPFELANLVVPTSLGDPTSDADIEGLPGLAEYWPPLVKRGANFAESAVTIGPLVLLLLFFAPWRERRVLGPAVLGGLALLLALGTALNYPLYFFAPGWSSTGSPGRIIVLFVMAACVLAALGFERLKASDRRLLLLGIGGTALLSLLTAVGMPGMAPAADGSLQPVQSVLAGLARVGSLPLLGFGLLIALGGAWALWKRKAPAAAGPALAVVISLFSLALTLVPTGAAPETPRSVGPAAGRVAVVNQNWGIQIRPSAIFPPNTISISGTSGRFREIGGYDSLLHRDTLEILRGISGQDPAPPENGNMMFVKPEFSEAALAEAGVTQVWSKAPLPGRDANVFSIPGPGRAYTEAGPAEIVSEGYSHVTVRAAGPGTLHLKDRNMPGWTAWIGRRQTPNGSGMWHQVELPAGEHTVEFRYDPPGLSAGLMLFALGTISFVLLLLLGRSPKIAPAPAD